MNRRLLSMRVELENRMYFARMRGRLLALALCPMCNGTTSCKQTCGRCKGTGQVERRCDCGYWHDVDCPVCYGDGHQVGPCPRCNAEGWVDPTELPNRHEGTLELPLCG